MIKKVLKIGSAFIGIIIGAGFASGQEILQYFTSFGHLGILAALVSTALFAYLGMVLARLGSRLQTTSHKEAIYKISGRYFGPIIDYVIIFALFGTGVVMIAGAGSILHQQFGLMAFIGSGVMTVLVILTVMMDVKKVIVVISSITPFLILTVVLVSVYSLVTMDKSFAELTPIAEQQTSALSNWFIASINYVSFNIAFGASMTLLMGGAEKDERIAGIGGFVGGLGLGVLIILGHLAIFSQVDKVAMYDMPMLQIVENISPIFALIMSVIMFGMIFNTAVSMFYAFTARFNTMNTKKANIFVTITTITAFVASFAGFKQLINSFYPIIGYAGLFLVIALIVASFRVPRRVEE